MRSEEDEQVEATHRSRSVGKAGTLGASLSGRSWALLEAAGGKVGSSSLHCPSSAGICFTSCGNDLLGAMPMVSVA